jgi:hypothetical protein
MLFIGALLVRELTCEVGDGRSLPHPCSPQLVFRTNFNRIPIPWAGTIHSASFHAGSTIEL